MNILLNQIKEKRTVDNRNYQPTIYKLSKSEDREKLTRLLETHKTIKVYDEIVGQVEEFIKSTNPKIVFSAQELNRAALEHLAQMPHEEFGVWVYYPWSDKLIHLLDEQDFITVRTNRNQYKITPQEKELLATKKIGVIGLSVGQSIALTLAMERTFGELRIADYDILELSNLNRIRTGVSNLGIPKTIAVAREIAEIDPFLKVTCFHDGITEENIEQFIFDNGKLDLLVDECDGLSVKILCRQYAKKHGIPVIMDTSDRGMIDVERFDLEPNRSIFHGFIDHLDINKVKLAKTNEEKIPFILPMVDVDNISTRLKASMMEVGETVTTWPQLASSVVLGGGLGADVSRRILLDQFHDSGRYYVNPDELICDKSVDTNLVDRKQAFSEYHNFPRLTKEEMNTLISKTEAFEQSKKEHIPDLVLKEILEAAITAPSGGNCQPWKWVYSNNELFLFFEKSDSKSFLDYNDTAAYSTLGAAVENLYLKAEELGYEVSEISFPLGEDEKLISQLCFKKSDNTGNNLSQLSNAIFSRCTNRIISEQKMIANETLQEFNEIISDIKEAKIQFITNQEQIEIIGEIAGKADRLRFLHPQCHYDLYYNEVRWNKKQNEERRDGVDLETIPFTDAELAGFKMAMDDRAINLLSSWNKGRAFEKATKKAVKYSSAIGLVTMPSKTKMDYYAGGKAFERVWLYATHQNISIIG